MFTVRNESIYKFRNSRNNTKLLFNFAANEFTAARIFSQKKEEEQEQENKSLIIKTGQKKWENLKKERDQIVRIFNSSTHRSAVVPPYYQRSSSGGGATTMQRKLFNKKYLPLTPYEETLVSSIYELQEDTIITHESVKPPLTAKSSDIARGCSVMVNDAFIASYFYLLQQLCGRNAFIMDMNQTLLFMKEIKNKNSIEKKVLQWKRTRELLSYPNEYKLTVMAYPTGRHWFLVIGNREARCIEIYDSLPGAGEDYYEYAIALMLEFLNIVYQPITRMQDVGELMKYAWNCKPYSNIWQNIPKQQDFTSCGIYTILFARYRCMNLEFDFRDKIDIEYFRKLLLLEIYYARIPYISTNLEEDDWDPATQLIYKPPLIKPTYPRVYENGYIGIRAWKITFSFNDDLLFSDETNLWDILEPYLDESDDETGDPFKELETIARTTDLYEALNGLGYAVYWLPVPYTKLGMTDEYDLVKIIGTEILELGNLKLLNSVKILVDTNAKNIIEKLIFQKLKYKSVNEFLASLGWYPADILWQKINSDVTSNKDKKSSSMILSTQGVNRKTADIINNVFKINSIKDFL